MMDWKESSRIEVQNIKDRLLLDSIDKKIKEQQKINKLNKNK